MKGNVNLKCRKIGRNFQQPNWHGIPQNNLNDCFQNLKFDILAINHMKTLYNLGQRQKFKSALACMDYLMVSDYISHFTFFVYLPRSFW